MSWTVFPTWCPLVHIWNFCFKLPATVSQHSQILFPLVAFLHGTKKYHDETLHSTHHWLPQDFLKIDPSKREGSVFASHHSVGFKHLLLEPSVVECFVVAKKVVHNQFEFHSGLWTLPILTKVLSRISGNSLHLSGQAEGTFFYPFVADPWKLL